MKNILRHSDDVSKRDICYGNGIVIKPRVISDISRKYIINGLIRARGEWQRVN